MKQVRNTLGRLVQRINGKARAAAPVQPVQPPQEVEDRVLSQASGGVGASVQSPFKGW